MDLILINVILCCKYDTSFCTLCNGNMFWTLTMLKTNEFSLISGSQKPLVLILDACQVFLNLSGPTKLSRFSHKHQVALWVLWFYTCSKNMVIAPVQHSSFSFWYALSLYLSKLHLKFICKAWTFSWRSTGIIGVLKNSSFQMLMKTTNER